MGSRHIKKEHHMWNYLYFLVYLDSKEADDYSYLEHVLAEKLISEEYDFFPINRSLSLVKDDDADAEGNAIATALGMLKNYNALETGQSKLLEELKALRDQASQSQSLIQILITRPLFCQNGAKPGFEMCFGPSTLGAGAKTRLHTPKAVTYHEQPHYCRFMIGHSLGRMESRIKEFTPPCVCRPSAATQPKRPDPRGGHRTRPCQ